MKKVFFMFVFASVVIFGNHYLVFADDSENLSPFSLAGADEEFNCEPDVISRSGTHDFTRCKNAPGRIACYEEIRQTCKERNSERKLIINYQHFTGACRESYSDCY